MQAASCYYNNISNNNNDNCQLLVDYPAYKHAYYTVTLYMRKKQDIKCELEIILVNLYRMKTFCKEKWLTFGLKVRNNVQMSNVKNGTAIWFNLL